jgi:hypothetical protein
MIHSRFVRLLSILAVSLMAWAPITANPAVATSHASPPTTVSGTLTLGNISTTWTQHLGAITLEGYANPATLVGGISGEVQFAGELTLFADGSGRFNETETVFGSVLGRMGAFVEQNVGTTSSNGSFQGSGVIVEGIGGLRGIHGTISFQSINAQSASYTGQVDFDPS